MKIPGPPAPLSPCLRFGGFTTKQALATLLFIFRFLDATCGIFRIFIQGHLSITNNNITYPWRGMNIY